MFIVIGLLVGGFIYGFLVTFGKFRAKLKKEEIKKEGIDMVSKKYEAIVNFIQTEFKW